MMVSARCMWISRVIGVGRSSGRSMRGGLGAEGELSDCSEDLRSRKTPGCAGRDCWRRSGPGTTSRMRMTVQRLRNRENGDGVIHWRVSALPSGAPRQAADCQEMGCCISNHAVHRMRLMFTM